MVFPISDSGLVRRSFPYVNVALIVICAAVFIYELVIGLSGRVVFMYQFGLIPAELTQGINLTALRTDIGTFNITSPIPNWGAVLTSMFIHEGWLHFASNMLYLWVFGDNIEDRLGHFKYLLFYLAAGGAAAFLQIFFSQLSEDPMIGASGCIAGVLGAYLVFFPANRIKTVVFLFFITVIQIPAVLLLGFWFLLQFVSGVGSLAPSVQAEGVAYWAHVGGFVFGLVIAGIIRLFGGRPRSSAGPEEPSVRQYWRGRPL